MPKGTKFKKEKRGRKKNPEPTIHFSTTWAKAILLCCGSDPEDESKFTPIDLFGYKVLQGEEVPLSLVIDTKGELERLGEAQPPGAIKEEIEGFVEGLEFMISKHVNPARAFSLETEVKRSRQKRAKKAALSSVAAESGARSARAESVRRTLASLNPGEGTLSSYQGKLERLGDVALSAEHRKLSRLLKGSKDPDRDFGTQGLPMLEGMIDLAAKEKARRKTSNPREGRGLSAMREGRGISPNHIEYHRRTIHLGGKNEVLGYVRPLWRKRTPLIIEELLENDTYVSPSMVDEALIVIMNTRLPIREARMAIGWLRRIRETYLELPVVMWPLAHTRWAMANIDAATWDNPIKPFYAAFGYEALNWLDEHPKAMEGLRKSKHPMQTIAVVTDQMLQDGLYVERERALRRIHREGARLSHYTAKEQALARSGKSGNPKKKDHSYLTKCREAWEKYCASPTKRGVQACYKKFEKGIKHADVAVRKECRRGLRACRLEMREWGLKPNPSYHDAMGMEVTQAQAIKEIVKHLDGLEMTKGQAVKAFFADVGEKDEYLGEEVIGWLGY